MIDSCRSLHESVLKRIHVAAGVTRHLHDSLGSPRFFQNASILAFVSPRFCLQSLSFSILRRSPFARRPISPPSFLVVPHSLSIPSIVRNVGKFSNSIPLLTIFDRRFLSSSAQIRRCDHDGRALDLRFRRTGLDTSTEGRADHAPQLCPQPQPS